MQTDLLETASNLPLRERIEPAEALWESVVIEGNIPQRQVLRSTNWNAGSGHIKRDLMI